MVLQVQRHTWWCTIVTLSPLRKSWLENSLAVRRWSDQIASIYLYPSYYSNDAENELTDLYASAPTGPPGLANARSPAQLSVAPRPPLLAIRSKPLHQLSFSLVQALWPTSCYTHLSNTTTSLNPVRAHERGAHQALRVGDASLSPPRSRPSRYVAWDEDWMRAVHQARVHPRLPPSEEDSEERCAMRRMDASGCWPSPILGSILKTQWRIQLLQVYCSSKTLVALYPPIWRSEPDKAKQGIAARWCLDKEIWVAQILLSAATILIHLTVNLLWNYDIWLIMTPVKPPLSYWCFHYSELFES